MAMLKRFTGSALALCAGMLSLGASEAKATTTDDLSEAGIDWNYYAFSDSGRSASALVWNTTAVAGGLTVNVLHVEMVNALNITGDPITGDPDTLVPVQVLTAGFWSGGAGSTNQFVDIKNGGNNPPTLDGLSSAIASGVRYENSTTVTVGDVNVGGESSFVGGTPLHSALTQNMGLTTSGFGVLSSGGADGIGALNPTTGHVEYGNLNGPVSAGNPTGNLSGPVALDGLQYGMAPTGNWTTNGGTNTNLVVNSISFSVYRVSVDLDQMNDFRFQYGTSLGEYSFTVTGDGTGGGSRTKGRQGGGGGTVPEPGTLALAGLGLLGLGARTRRNARR